MWKLSGFTKVVLVLTRMAARMSHEKPFCFVVHPTENGSGPVDDETGTLHPIVAVEAVFEPRSSFHHLVSDQGVIEVFQGVVEELVGLSERHERLQVTQVEN